jgi:hypothetical protein
MGKYNEEIISLIKESIKFDIENNYPKSFTYYINYLGKDDDLLFKKLSIYIQAWHDLYNPGHHRIELHGDLSGSLILAPNSYPPRAKTIELRDSLIDKLKDKTIEREVLGEISKLMSLAASGLECTVFEFSSINDFFRTTDDFFEQYGYKIIINLAEK